MTSCTHLPGSTTDEWDWQLHSACRGVDSSIFFSPDGERGRARARRERQAKELCRECPVIIDCRTYALSFGEPYGVWGGMTEGERYSLHQYKLKQSFSRSPNN